MPRARSRLASFFWGYSLGVGTLLVIFWSAGILGPRSASADRSASRTPRTDVPDNARDRRVIAPRQREEMIGPVSDVDRLIQRRLALPIDNLKLEQIEDTFNDTRGGTRRHEATDILSPRGTPVRAIDDGIIEKLFTS
jgi:murein DD-endopeptidase MepM/ murein hydrolase activator NlpD